MSILTKLLKRIPHCTNSTTTKTSNFKALISQINLCPATSQHFFSDHLSIISSIKTVGLINAIQNVDCGVGSGHEPGRIKRRSWPLLSESVCGDVFASLSTREVYGAMKAFPIKASTITSCDIHSARPFRPSDAF